MEATGIVLLSLLAVVISGFLARATRLPLPFVQMALGAGIALAGLHPVVLDPQLFFLLFLPPLLFLDGWRIPNDQLVREAGSIARLALGLVLVTVLGLGWFIHWLLPAMPLAVAFALAAVISPTDPIAVTALAAHTPVPRRLMHILQGEALLNDASGLVCMRLAVAAALSGSFSLPAALAGFVWTVAGGLLVGAVATWAVARTASWASQRYGDDGGAPILVTLLLPFGVYLLAERLHVSGILAAVAAGITMSLTELWHWRAATRLRRTAVWDVVQLAANGSIFVLLGEQIPALLAAAPDTARSAGQSSVWGLLAAVLAIVALLLLLRLGWVWASLALARLRAQRRSGAQPAVGWRLPLAATLAGVRGAVTLAGVLTLPLVLDDGQPFPSRDLAIVLAAGVIVLTLALATVALPRTLRGLQLGPEPSHLVAEDSARAAAARAALLAIDEAVSALQTGGADAGHAAQAAARVKRQYLQRLARHGDGRSAALRRSDNEVERELRLVGLHAEREEITRLARGDDVDDTLQRRLVRELDLQETRHRS